MDTLPTTKNIDDFTGVVWHADALDLLRALPDKSVDLILTDPPYGTTQAHYDKLDIDFAAIGAELFRVIKPDGAVICTAELSLTVHLLTLWERYFRYEWIWRKTRKTNFLNAKKMPLAAHEHILVFGHKLPRYFPQMQVGDSHRRGGKNRGTELYGDFEPLEKPDSNLFYQSTVIAFAHDPELSITVTQKPNKAANHPNQKPLKLWKYLIKTYSCEGDIVLDCFAGSGTTAIASIATKRRFICGDNYLPYVDMAITRLLKPVQFDILESFSGNEAQS
jgi:site-specific DNA-methyltransferase (adenine-specific)